MSWESIGGIADAIGALAVVITLFYLALQMRQNTRQARSEALRVATESWVGQQRSAFETEEKVAFMRRALHDYSALSQDEKGRFFGVLLGYLAPFNDIRDKHVAGLMEDPTFHAIEEAFASVVTSPGARDCIESFQQHTSLPPFVMEYVRGDLPARKKIPPMSESFDFAVQIANTPDRS